MDNPFKLTIYDKAFKRVGWLGDALSVSATPIHNAAGTLDVTVGSNNAKMPLLMAPGARVTCEYGGDQILSGMIRSRTGKGPYSQGTISFTAVDDFRLLSRILGWPVPSASLDAQSVEYYTITGPAETVVKTLVSQNAVTRLGIPVTVAPDLGRGATITASLRFHPLYDRLFPAVDAAGIGVTVKQSGAGFVVDCYTPRTYPQTLTEASGVVTSWEWSNAAPEVTRGVTGGKGEGVARQLVGFSDTTREATWGDVAETFVDARDADTTPILNQRSADALTTGQELTGLKLTLSETPNFKYGVGLSRGDKVQLEVGPGLTITDTLRQAALSWTRSGGLEVNPQVGDITNNPSLDFARAIRNLATKLQNLGRI